MRARQRRYPCPSMTYERYVAIGDSSTEGLFDHDGDGGFRGWADRLAEHVARAQGSVRYANLAIRGRMTRQILDEQLPVAVEMRPDLATVVAGMNDLIRPRFDARVVVDDIEAMFAALRGGGATVLTFTLPAPGPGMPLARLLQPRVSRYNRALRAAARRTGARVLDLEAVPVASDPRLWSEDRLHGNAEGHERVAAGFAQLIGLQTPIVWSEPLPPMPRRPVAETLAADLAWARAHLVPWVQRHLRGESSGDGITPKRPRLEPVVADA